MNRITAGTLVIGRNDIATGTVTVSSAIAPANATALSIITARNIAVNANLTGGSGGVTLSANQQAIPTSGIFDGVAVSGATITTTGNGNVSVIGRGGDTGTDNLGVSLQNAGRITAGGSGTVTVTGTGGTSIGNTNHGVWVREINSQITSSGGAVVVNGTGGGAGSSTGNYGVILSFFGVITSAGTGSGATVSVTGQGGNTSGTGSSNIGVSVVAEARISSSGGALLVEGTGTSNSAAVQLQISGEISSGSNAAITITADSLDFDTVTGSVIFSGGGTTTIRTRTAGTLIDLGGADVLSGSPLTLGLTSDELNQITAGTLVIGRNDIATGTVTVSQRDRPEWHLEAEPHHRSRDHGFRRDHGNQRRLASSDGHQPDRGQRDHDGCHREHHLRWRYAPSSR